jgi:hypothetical protein
LKNLCNSVRSMFHVIFQFLRESIFRFQIHANRCYPGRTGPEIKCALPLLLKILISKFIEICSVISETKHAEGARLLNMQTTQKTPFLYCWVMSPRMRYCVYWTFAWQYVTIC